MTTWDPDGAGPLPAVLACAGDRGTGFPDEARVAVFDGTRWTQLGSLSGLGAEARAIASFNGQLIVALEHRLVVWSGSGWQTFAVVGGVDVMCVHAGELIVGGSFTQLSGSWGITFANRIARWTGSSWAALGSGLNGTPKAMASFQGVLYVGGSFSTAGGTAVGNLAIWTGSTWVATPFANGPVTALATRVATALTQTWLFVGGAFTSLGAVAQHVVRFSPATNTWTAMGAGLPGTGCSALRVRVTGVNSYELAAAIPDWLPDMVLRWNAATSTWVGLGQPYYQYPVQCLGLWAGQYVAGLDAETLLAVHRFTGAAWEPLAGEGILGDVHAVLADGAETIIAGQFPSISGATVNSIARGTPGNWSAMGSGFFANTVPGAVVALSRMPNGDVVAGGSFLTAGGQPADNIARWNGIGWSPLGSGVGGGVTSLSLQANGDVIVGGYFTTAGGAPANRIARWNGVGWSALGNGCNSWPTSLLTLANGDVVAGGWFTDVGTRIARWDGSAWSPMGSGSSIPVLALAELPDGSVLAAGTFAGVASTVARWNGGAWVAVESAAPGLSFAPSALCVLADGDVVAAGLMGAARLHGGAWTSLGTASSVLALGQGVDGVLRVGGRFDGIADVAAARFAQRELPCPAVAVDFAAGCASSGGNNLLAATALPWANNTFRAMGTGLPTTALVLALTSVTPVPGLPLDLVLAEALPGCNLDVVPDILEALFTTDGTAQSQLFLPDVPPIVGVTFYHQMIPFEVDALGGIVAVSATNALQLTAGTF